MCTPPVFNITSVFFVNVPFRVPKKSATGEYGECGRKMGKCVRCGKRVLQKGMVRHMNQHLFMITTYTCPKRKCGRQYNEEHNYNAHYRDKYMEGLKEQPLADIPDPIEKEERNPKYIKAPKTTTETQAPVPVILVTTKTVTATASATSATGEEIFGIE